MGGKSGRRGDVTHTDSRSPKIIVNNFAELRSAAGRCYYKTVFQLAWSSGKSANLPDSPPRAPVISVCRAAFHMWEEHCLECSPPDCYSSCKLFVARADRKCARFEFGIQVNPHFNGIEGFGAQIRFRRWAKLQTPWVSRPRLYTMDELHQLNQRLRRTEQFVSLTSSIIAGVNPKRRLNGALHHYLNRSFPSRAQAALGAVEKPEGFQLCFFALGPEQGALFFEIVSRGHVIYRRRVPIVEGWNTDFIPWRELEVESHPPCFARIWLENDSERTIIFTHAHLVQLAGDVAGIVSTTTAPPKILKPAAKVKCVVFDLDNTLWDGVIGDDGTTMVRVRQQMVDLIHALDARGIICAVASKNDFEVAWSKILEIGLNDYLLFPQINWGPKPDSIARIADAMNIGRDAMAFIDDSQYERDLVSANLPEVRVYSDEEACGLLSRPEFDVPITQDARNRRQSYLAESRRAAARASLGLNLDAFIESSELSLSVLPARDHLERCHELVMRTNQFNISGQKYPAGEFAEIAVGDNALCWRVVDRYGDYGIVGFVRIGPYRDGVAVLDFVMSCRVAEKRNEEAIIESVIRERYPGKVVYFPFTLTGRNRPLLEKIIGIGTREVERSSDALLLALDAGTTIRGANVIKVGFSE